MVGAPLGRLPAAVAEAGLISPTLVIIGRVVSLLRTEALADAADALRTGAGARAGAVALPPLPSAELLGASCVALSAQQAQELVRLVRPDLRM